MKIDYTKVIMKMEDGTKHIFHLDNLDLVINNKVSKRFRLKADFKLYEVKTTIWKRIWGLLQWKK